MDHVEEKNESDVTRRALLGTSAVLAGAGIVGSQLVDPVAKTAFAAGSDEPIRI